MSTDDYHSMEVSIITPVYNAEHFLRRTIDSVRKQSYPYFEWIIVDDGSTDNSRMICQEAALEDNRIKLILQDNKGVSAARNSGIVRSQGKYIVFLDADDYLPFDSIMHRIKAIRSSDFLITDYYEVDELTGREIKSLRRKIKNGTCRAEDAIRLLFSPGRLGYQGFLWNKMFVSEIIRDRNIQFDTNISYNEDRLFIFKYLHFCRIVALSDLKACFYVHHEDSKMGQLYMERFRPEMLTELVAFDLMKKQLFFEKSETYFLCCRDMSVSARRLLPLVQEDSGIAREIKDIEFINLKEIVLSVRIKQFCIALYQMVKNMIFSFVKKKIRRNNNLFRQC